MSTNPRLIQTLANDRANDRSRALSNRCIHAPDRDAAFRVRTGWLLIDLGLRLAVPRGRATNRLA